MLVLVYAEKLQCFIHYNYLIRMYYDVQRETLLI